MAFVIAPVLEMLEPLRRLIEAIEQELKAQTKAISAVAPAELPLGLGKLTYHPIGVPGSVPTFDIFPFLSPGPFLEGVGPSF